MYLFTYLFNVKEGNSKTYLNFLHEKEFGIRQKHSKQFNVYGYMKHQFAKQDLHLKFYASCISY